MSSPSTPHILIVEDNSCDATLLERSLRKSIGEELRAQTVQSLAAALEALATTSFDLVLLDLNLPDSTGLETFFEVERAAEEVSVVVLTGMEDPGSSLAAMRAGAEDYLVKGELEAESMARAIRRAVERRASHERRREEERRLEESERARRLAEMITDLASELDEPVELLIHTSTHVSRRMRDLQRALKRWSDRAHDSSITREQRDWIENMTRELQRDFSEDLSLELEQAQQQSSDAARRTREILRSMRRYLDWRAGS